MDTCNGVSGGTSHVRRGKVSPVNTCSGVDPECVLRTSCQCLRNRPIGMGGQRIQLAGHLKGRALQELNLLRDNTVVVL